MTQKSSSGLQVPIFAFLVGTVLIVSALQGRSVIDILAGLEGDQPLDSKGHSRMTGTTNSMDSAITQTGGSNAELASSGGAVAIVERAANIAAQADSGNHVVSSSRPGSTTTSGNVSDHSQNNSSRAARDIAYRNVNALTGPPNPALDKAVVLIGRAFGRNYRPGQRIVDTFNWNGYRIQIIWRTPSYGGHMGHIHVGARKL